ncbi:MAG: hypothetical protein V4467_05165 [Patescibacteria group bacterium]
MKNLADSLAVGTPQHVVAHANWRRHRKSAGPTAPFNGIRNPRLALLAARTEVERMGQSFGHRLAGHLTQTQNGSIPFATVEMQTLAHGVVAAKDTLGDVDVYFDREGWKLADPEMIGAETAFPPGLEGADIGVLFGAMSQSEIITFADARKFAKRCLEARGKISWYKNGPKISMR